MPKLKIVVIITFVIFSLMPVISIANTSIIIDAAQDCFDLTALTADQVANFTLAAGTYVASLTKNTMKCNSGECPITSIVIWGGVTPSTGIGSGNSAWGLAVTKTPTVVVVPKIIYSHFFAFVVDNPCSDNKGTATLLFRNVE